SKAHAAVAGTDRGDDPLAGEHQQIIGRGVRRAIEGQAAAGDPARAHGHVLSRRRGDGGRNACPSARRPAADPLTRPSHEAATTGRQAPYDYWLGGCPLRLCCEETWAPMADAVCSAVPTSISSPHTAACRASRRRRGWCRSVGKDRPIIEGHAEQ